MKKYLLLMLVLIMTGACSNAAVPVASGVVDSSNYDSKFASGPYATDHDYYMWLWYE